MTTAPTTPRTTTVGVDRSTIRPPGLVRLTRVEMRKMVDTRSGFWLLLIIGLLTAGFVVLNLFGGSESDRTFNDFFQGSQLPVGLLLPVLGIMMVTSEWSQRTTLATFSLVPRRLTVVLAKILAGVVYAVLSLVSSAVFAAIGFGLALALDRAPADASWSVPAAVIGGSVLTQVLGMLSGIAFGLLLMNTPSAIVLYFVLPTALTVLATGIKVLSDWLVWLDINQPSRAVGEGTASGSDWGHLATASVLWVWAPLILGGLRLIRREVK